MSANFVKHNIAYNKTLAPEVWSNGTIHKEVRYKLLQAAKMFIDYLEMPNFKLIDVVLTGSMANFNYTQFSDFDLHIITEYKDLECDDLAEEFYQAKKKIWNDGHDIIIRGHEVELYIEDNNNPSISAGIYSLLDNVWLQRPLYDPPTIADSAVNKKVDDLLIQINKTLEQADDPEDITRLFAKLRRMRQSGLESGGEYSVENLAYKVLRNLGYLDRLSKAKKDQQDADLSLD